MNVATVSSPFEPRFATPRPSGPWHRKVAGLNVLKVTGSFYEMGYQHGSLLRDEVATGPIAYYKTYVEKFAGRSALGPLSPLLWPAVKLLLGRRVARKLPSFAQESIRGLIDGSGLPASELMAGMTMADSLVWLASRFIDVRRVGPAVYHRLALGLGCTSALAWGEATVDGRLLHARNMDYHGVGCWPRTASVVFHAPDHGQRYVAVAAAGILLGGVTAMNEAGLTLTVHQHMFTNAAELGGTPIGTVGDIVMRKAESLDDAVRILSAHKPIGCWTYLIADGRRREVLCWEENPRRQVAHRFGPDDARLGYANIYLDPELGRTERNLYGSYWRHNQGRHRRANERLAEGHGRLDPDAMASILGDRGLADCRLGESIAMLLTVGSVVFRPEDGIVWVAAGEAPTSQRAFVPFSLEAEDHAPEHGLLRGGLEDDPAEASAFEAYRRAYLAFLDDEDLPASRAELERARELRPSEPLYHALAGLLAITDGDARAAFEAFDRSLALGHAHPERAGSFRLWQGRAADLLGRRGQAEASYREALAGPADPPVHAAARRGLRRPYTARQARKVHVDFAFADVVAP